MDYTYDAVGNRLTEGHSITGTATYAYDNNDRLLTTVLGVAATQYIGDFPRQPSAWDNSSRCGG